MLFGGIGDPEARYTALAAGTVEVIRLACTGLIDAIAIHILAAVGGAVVIVVAIQLLAVAIAVPILAAVGVVPGGIEDILPHVLFIIHPVPVGIGPVGISVKAVDLVEVHDPVPIGIGGDAGFIGTHAGRADRPGPVAENVLRGIVLPTPAVRRLIRIEDVDELTAILLAVAVYDHQVAWPAEHDGTVGVYPVLNIVETRLAIGGNQRGAQGP